jgi:hypothetical protein
MNHYMLMPLYLKGQVKTFVSLDPEDYRTHSVCRWLWDKDGYGHRYVGKPGKLKVLWLHRAILKPPDYLEVDHRNLNKRDNRRSNLLAVTHAQNHENRPANSNSTSRFRGVCWDATRQRWQAKCKLKGRTHNLGRFLVEQDAADAAAQFRAKHMPYSAEGRLGV